MQTNLIQNFIQTQTTQQLQQQQQKPKKKEAPKFDIHYELANRTFIKPLKGRGRLLESSILDAPANFAKGLAYDAKALAGGINGDANDHQLGKLNDIGMKLGGLTIAGYLFTKRQTPLTKAMEFVGLGSFFASMALWPKIAIQLPAYLIHGFNVQQQYEDSFGRKKPFYQDPQFLPWDLYADDEINKIGDRLGVPKNIPNRREYIQEKMKKIAIQNNTLWMLTAGFATPIMSALICNALEKPLAKPLAKMRNSDCNNIISNFNDIVKKENYNEINKDVENIIAINRNKTLTPTLMDELCTAMTKGFPEEITNLVKTDLDKMVPMNNYIINSNTVRAISKGSQKALLSNGVPEEIVKSLVLQPEKLTEYFENKGFYGNEYSDSDIRKVFNEYVTDLQNQISEYNKNNEALPKAIKNKIINALVRNKNNPVITGLKSEHGTILNPKAEKTIKGLASAMNKLRGEMNVLDTYLLEQLGTAPETTIANYWNDTVGNFAKSLKLTPKELAETRGDRLLMQKLLINRYENIAANPTEYKKTVTSMLEQMSQMTRLIKQVDANENILNSKETAKIDKIIDSVFKNFDTNVHAIEGFKDGNMENLLNEMLGFRKNPKAPRGDVGATKNMYKRIVSNRLLEVKSSFFRIINSLDLYRRIATGNPANYITLDKETPRVIKEDIVDLSKLISVSGHTSDYLTKFYSLRDPQINTDDVSDIEVKNGKMERKYKLSEVSGELVDMPQDAKLFEKAMKLQYQDELLKETLDIFGVDGKNPKFKELFEEFKTYRTKVLNEVGNAYAIEKGNHKAVENGVSSMSNAMIFRITGAATDEVMSNYGKQAFNTNKWLKMFGTAGAVLLGVTVLSQFFFGRMKLPQVQQAQDTKKG